MLLFIQSYLRGDIESLHFKLALVVIMWMLVSVAIGIDLITGLKKAKERGEVRSSIGLRQTVKKVIQYYSFLLFAFLFDCLLMLIFYVFDWNELRVVPFMSMGSSLFLIFIEWRSFMEKATDKQRKKFTKGVKELMYLMEHRDQIFDGIKHTLNNKKKDKEVPK